MDMIKQKPVSDQHLLLSMELWFDGSVPLSSKHLQHSRMMTQTCQKTTVHFVTSMPKSLHTISMPARRFLYMNLAAPLKARNLLNNMIPRGGLD